MKKQHEQKKEKRFEFQHIKNRYTEVRPDLHFYATNQHIETAQLLLKIIEKLDEITTAIAEKTSPVEQPATIPEKKKSFLKRIFK